MKKQFLSFVLPAYNEEGNVVILTDKIAKVMKTIKADYEILFIVEGTDNTVKNLKNYQKKYKEVPLRFLYEEKPLGLMNAFKKGFNNVSKKTTHVVTMDVDLNHKPEELHRLVEKSAEGYDIVIGSRAAKGGKVVKIPIWKRLLSKTGNLAFKVLFGINVKDKTNGYRMIEINTIKEIGPKVKSTGFEGLMEFLLIANRKGKKITEVPITMILRRYGKSKYRVASLVKGYSRLLARTFEIRNI